MTNLVIAKDIYSGHMYTNSTIAVTISNSNPTEVGNTFTTGLVRGVAFGASHYLDVGSNGAGRYRVSWNMSAAQNSPAATIAAKGGIMVDGVAQNEGRSYTTLPNSTNIRTMSGCAILDLAASEQVSLFVRNGTNTTNIDVLNANLIIVMMDKEHNT